MCDLFQNAQDGGARRFNRGLFGALVARFVPRALGAYWVSDIFCPIESDTFYKALTLYWL